MLLIVGRTDTNAKNLDHASVTSHANTSPTTLVQHENILSDKKSTLPCAIQQYF